MIEPELRPWGSGPKCDHGGRPVAYVCCACEEARKRAEAELREAVRALLAAHDAYAEAMLAMVLGRDVGNPSVFSRAARDRVEALLKEANRG